VRLAGYATGAAGLGVRGGWRSGRRVACRPCTGTRGRWLINEKGMVAATGGSRVAPAGFAEQAQRVLGAVGCGPRNWPKPSRWPARFIAAVGRPPRTPRTGLPA